MIPDQTHRLSYATLLAAVVRGTSDRRGGDPGSSSEVLSKQFSTNANTLRPVMRKLIDDGKVRTKGEKRGTRYSVAT